MIFKNPPSIPPDRTNERGNALVYILIAVGLLIALSMAISSSMRGDPGRIEEDRAGIIAGEIVEYSSIMGNAVAQLRLRGVSISQLCFDHDSWDTLDYDHAGCVDDLNKIYHPSGAGISWSEAPSLAMDDVNTTPDNLWHIYSDNEIEGVGTTCGTGECSELILVVDQLKGIICEEINNLLGIENPGGEPPIDDNIGEERFTGSFGYEHTIGDTPTSSNLAGQVAGCFQRSANDEYVFYKVLIAR